MKNTFTYSIMVICILLFSATLSAQQTVTETYDTSGAYSFTVPVGVTTITVQAWGGGGAGGAADATGTVTITSGSGGGSGGYVSVDVAVTDGQTYSGNVAQSVTGGTGDGSTGSNSTFNLSGTEILTAFGGTGGRADQGDAGSGGTVNVPTNTNVTNINITTGQDGDVGTDTESGAGGSAPNTADGGGAGGTSVSGATADGNPGESAGGGGSGGFAEDGDTATGGGGAKGLVIITYECPEIVIDDPGDETIAACNQDDVNTEYDNWIAGFSFSGGCNATETFSYDPENQAPDFCGGTVTVVYTVEGDEQTAVVTSAFTAEDADPVAYDFTASTNIDNDDFVADACLDQSELDDLFDEWIATVSNSFSGGCGLNVTNTWDGEYPERCGDVVTVTFTAESDCEDDVEETLTFTVTQQPMPTFITTMPTDESEDLPADVCEKLISWDTVNVDDACEGDVQLDNTHITVVSETDPNLTNLEITSGTTQENFPPGVTTITYSYTDGCDQNISHTFTITITDTQEPVISSGQEEDITTVTDEDLCVANVSWVNPNVEDNCPVEEDVDIQFADGTTENFELNPGATVDRDFPVGISTVTFIASDFNNTTTRSFTVTVTDEQVPTFTCPVADGTTHTADSDGDECYATLDFTVTDADDNCGVSTITYSVDGVSEVVGSLADGTLTATFEYDFPVGTSTVTIEVQDVNGNSTSCRFDVTVEDVEDPVVDLTPITRSLDEVGVYTLTQTDVNNIIDATDNCGVVTPTIDSIQPNTFNCNDIGTNTVTVTVEDVNGNVVTQTTTVEIVDDEDPVVDVISGPKSRDIDSDECTWMAPDEAIYENWGLADNGTPSDNCTVVSLVYSLDGATTEVTGSNEDLRGQIFEVGVTTITWTAADQSGNTGSGSFVLTVTDNQSPSFTEFPEPDNPYFNDPGACTASLTFTAEAEDNCDIDHIKYYDDEAEISMPHDFPVGTTTVTVIATDINGLTVSDTFTVVVKDDEDPTIAECPEDITRTAEEGDCDRIIEWERPLFEDNCTATPTFDLSSEPEVEFLSAVNDADTGNKMDRAEFPIGITTVIYTVTDDAGNTSVCEFKVTLHAYDLPVAVAQDLEIDLDEYGQASITVTDADDGSTIDCKGSSTDIADFLTLSQYDFDCSHVGTNTVTLTVTDKTGRTATDTFIVTVNDITDPEITPVDPFIAELDAEGEVTVYVDDLYESYSDACGVDTSTFRFDETDFSIISLTFDCNDIGLTMTQTILVDDVNGNTGSAVAEIQVEDNLSPVLTVQDATVYLDDDGVAVITEEDVVNDVSDNCSIQTITFSPASFNCDDVGVHTVTITAIDESDNETNEEVQVTVEDNIPPDITCPTVADYYETDSGECFATVDLEATATDNCGIETIVYTLINGTEITFPYKFPTGTTTVTATATDVNELTDECEFVIDVRDREAPVVSNECPGDRYGLVEDCSSKYFDWTAPDFLDNCDDAITFNTNSDQYTFYTDRGTVDIQTSGHPSHGASFPVGITTVYYEATDEEGNVGTCSFTVTVDDGEDPVAVAVDELTIELDDDGLYTLTPEEVDDGSSDDCGILTMTVEPSEFTCDDVGTHTVVLTVYDRSLRTATATTAVTVEDNIPPVLTVTPTVVQLNDAGIASITFSDLATAEDACGIATETLSVYEFDCDDVGDVTVTVTATDNNNNTTEETVVVTVEDNIAPVLTLNDLDVYLDDNGVASITFNDVASATDACGIDTETLSRYEFDCSDVNGVVQVDVSAYDVNGNIETGTVSITVIDDIDPTIACVTDTFRHTTGPGEDDLVGECGYIVNGEEFDPLNYDDNCPDAIIYHDYTPATATNTLAGEMFPVGITTVVWTVEDASGNTTTCEIFIEVEDKEVPIFVDFPDDFNETTGSTGDCDEQITWDIPTFDDNCGVVTSTLDFDWVSNNSTASLTFSYLGSPATQVQADFPAGVTTITYSVNDIHGNTGYASFAVTINDQDDPIAIATDEVVDIFLEDSGMGYLSPEQIDDGSNDDCGDVILSVDPSEFTCTDLGLNTVVLTVTDLSGNTDTAEATVNVIDDIAPTLTCIDDIQVGTTTDVCHYIAVDGIFDPTTAEDNCTIVTQTYTLTGATDSDGPVVATTLDEILFELGETVVVWTATDQSNNTSSCTFTVTVVDDQFPTIACVDDQVVETDEGQCTYTVAGTEFDPANYDDNCPDPVLSYELTGVTTTTAAVATNTLQGVVFNKGITEVRWIIDDDAGNVSSCTFTVTVEDNELPTIACATDTFRYTTGPGDDDLVGICEYIVEGDEFDPVVDDNCEVATVSNTYNDDGTLAGETFPLDDTEVTWYVTDTSGNINSCTMTITVEDNEPPVYTDFPESVVISTPSTENCLQQHTWDNPVAIDNCDSEPAISSPTWVSNNPTAEIVFTEPSAGKTQANFPAGITTVTYEVSDIYGNVHSQSFSVTVDDQQDPVITKAPEDRDIEGCAVDDIFDPMFSAVMTQSSLAEFENDPNFGEANDNCDIFEVWYMDEIIKPDCEIVVERTWYVYDFFGRYDTVRQTITIDEEEAPYLVGTLPGEDVGNVCYDEKPDAPATASITMHFEDNCTDTEDLVATLTTTVVDGDDCGWTVTYTYTIADECENTTVAEVVYTGADTEAPQLVDADEDCSTLDITGVNECLAEAEEWDATVLIDDVDNLYVDNCAGTVSVTLIDTVADENNSNCTWTFTYTFQIEDDCGNSTTCEVTRSGGDTEAPELITDADDIPGGDVGHVCIDNRPVPELDDIRDLYEDNCTATASLTVTSSEELSGNDCGWTVTYTYSIEDACGNPATDLVVVFTGADTKAPVVENDPDFELDYSCTDEVPAANETSLVITDNCADTFDVGLSTSTLFFADCPHTYILTRTWTVTDQCDNTTVFDQVITVLDNESPVLDDPLVDCSTLDQQDLDWCYQEVVDFDASALAGDVADLYVDNCGTVTATWNETETVYEGDDCGWTATFFFEISDQCANTVTCTVTYTGSDQTAPEPGDTPYAGLEDVDACYDNALDAAPFDATDAVIGYEDNCGAPVTATLTNTELTGDDCGWTITYTFTVEDECGNELSGQTYTNTGSDQTPPALTGDPHPGTTGIIACLPTEAEAEDEFDADHAVEGYTDNCGGPVTATLTGTDVGGDDCAWIVTYTFTVEDECGNESTGQTYTDTGGDFEDPVIAGDHCGAEDPLEVTVDADCEYVADDSWDVTATDNCGPVTLSVELTGDTEMTSTVTNTLAGKVFNVGLTTITWTAEDDCGNVESCTFAVLIDVGPPSFKEPLPEDQVVDVDDSDVCTYTVKADDNWDAEVHDPCDQIDLSYELTGATVGTGTSTLEGVEFNCGVTTVTWTAEDTASELISTHTFTVTVQPTELTGTVAYYRYNNTDLPLAGFTVELLDADDGVVASTTTNATGHYSFTFGDAKVDVQAVTSIRITSNLQHGGLSSGDAYAIRLAALEDPESYPTYWDYPGGGGVPDYFRFMNRVGTVFHNNGSNGIHPSVVDAFQVFQRHMGNLDMFQAGNWAYMSLHDNALFNTAGNGDDPQVGYRGYAQDFCKMDIVVRPYGDVRGTYNFGSAKTYMPFDTDGVMHVSVGDVVELPVTLSKQVDYNAVSFYLGYNADQMEILDVALSNNDMTYTIEEDRIRVEWYDLDAQYLAEGEAFLTITARVLAEIDILHSPFSMGEETEFINSKAMPIPGIDALMPGITTAKDDVVDVTDPRQSDIQLKAFPNPFNEELTLAYTINEPGNVKMQLIDIHGAVVKELVDQHHESGSYARDLETGILGINYGLYFVRMEVQGSDTMHSTYVTVVYVK